MDPSARPELYITLGVFALEVALLAVCRVKLKQRVNPTRPRLVPYGGIMIFLTLALMFTAAHTVSLVTGKQLLPKTKQNGGAPPGMKGY